MKFRTDVFVSLNDDYDDIEYSLIVNQKLEGGNNYLHFLVSQLTDENYDDVSEMIKIMVINRCNPSFSNDQLETPFHQLLEKLQNEFDKGGLIKLFIENFRGDFNLHGDVKALIESRGFHEGNILRPQLVKNVDFMIQLCNQRNEVVFISEFENFKEASKDHRGDVAQLLKEAIVRNLIKVSNFLLINGADVNAVQPFGKFKDPPAFLACRYGHHEVLKVLINDPTMKFYYESSKQSLLHQICESEKIQENDRQKCFNAIIADIRCTVEIINSVDITGQTPLFHASRFGFNNIVKALLRRGAYIGHQSVVNNMQEGILEEFLDECVKCSSNVSDKGCEIHIDYRFLMSLKVDGKSQYEVRSVQMIAKNPKLKHLVLHPAIISFLRLKWEKVNFLFYTTLFLNFMFMVYLEGNIALSIENANEFPEENFTFDNGTYCDSQSGRYLCNNLLAFSICVAGTLFLGGYELVQCLSSLRKYFFKLENWLDMIWIVLACLFISGFEMEKSDLQIFHVLVVLSFNFQKMSLIAKIPFGPMALQLAIFQRVCSTYVKTLVLYWFLIFGFATTFYILRIDPVALTADDDDTFEKLKSVIRTVRMMLGDFGDEKTVSPDYARSFFFLLFIFLVTVVFFNLLNALAIRDTNEMTVEAELVSAEKTISIFNSFEKMFFVFKISAVDIFPEMRSITITPNIDNTIKVKHNNKPAKNATVSLHKKAETSRNVYRSSWAFWRKDKVQVMMCDTSVRKIVEFVKSRN